MKKTEIWREIKKAAEKYPVRVAAATVLLASVALTVIGAAVAGIAGQDAGNIVILAGGAAWFGGWTILLVAKLGTYAGKEW